MQRSFIKQMHQKRIISFVSALWLLLVFTLSITPKKYLHDAFSNHGDSCVAVAAENEATIIKVKVSCDVGNQVATVPFILVSHQYTVLLPAVTAVTNISSVYHCFAAPQYNFSLRGPPAV